MSGSSNNDIGFKDKVHNPIDTISVIKFHPVNTNAFAMCSWDGTVRLCELVEQTGYSFIESFDFICVNLPVLSFSWVDSSPNFYFGIIDGTVAFYDFSLKSMTKICIHNFAVKDLFYFSQHIFSFDCEKNVKVSKWDQVVADKTFHEDISTIAFNSCLFFVLFANCEYFLGRPEDLVSNNPKLSRLDMPYTPNCSAINEKERIIVVGCLEGISVVFRFEKEMRSDVYTISRNLSVTLKTNLKEEHREFKGFMVSSVCLIIQNEQIFIVTGGSDGKVSYWNVKSRDSSGTVIKQKNQPITAFDVNALTGKIVVGFGYDWARGILGMADIQYPPVLEVYSVPSTSSYHYPSIR